MHNNIIQELHLQNLLSFGPDTEPIKLKALNVLIGPNGSGKSNLLEAVSLLRAAPRDLSAPVKEAGGVRDWLWKGKTGAAASIEAIIHNSTSNENMPLRHRFSFIEHGNRFEITEELIENKDPYSNKYQSPYCYYRMENGHPRLFENPQSPPSKKPNGERILPRESINPEESVLSQVKDPERYPFLAYLTDIYSRFRLYREWSFGRYTSPRQQQKADLQSKYLSETCENLALVLNSIRPSAKNDLIGALNKLYPEIDDFNVQIDGGWVQLYLEEGKYSIPATRLSDGTLRYLCLLAILFNPNPSPLVCIEEPELGLHPDILPFLAELMSEASKRFQLIVTTHSEILIDALTGNPESVMVSEKVDGKTKLQRLEKKQLSKWLEKYRLGELWIKGEIGGTRW